MDKESKLIYEAYKGLGNAEYHQARKDAYEGSGEEIGNGPVKLQLKRDVAIGCSKSGKMQDVRFVKGTIFNCEPFNGSFYNCESDEYGSMSIFKDDVKVIKEEDAETPQDYADSMETDAPSQKLNTDKKPYNLNDTRNKFAAERGKNAGGSILKELEDHVRELAGPNATIDQAKAAFEQALKAPHARHFSHTLHNDLLATRGPQVKNRKFKDAGYYPPEGKFDWQYMKNWLQTHILMPYVGGGKYAGTTHYISR